MSRYVIAIGAVLVVLVALPLLVMGLWQDAHLEPGASQWLDPDVAEVADDDNLFYGIVGFSQPGDDDFVASGARLVEEANRILERLDSGETRPGDEEALEKWNGEALDEALQELCRPVEQPCMAEWRSRADELESLAERHRSLLERFERLHALTGYAMTLTPDYRSPFPAFAKVTTIHRLKMGLIGARCASGDIVAAMRDLDRDIAFSRRLMAEAHWLLTKMIGLYLLSEALHTHAECLDANHEVVSDASELSPLTVAERSLRRTMQTEFRSGARLFTQADKHPEMLAQETDIPPWMMGWLLKPNRTINLGYKFFVTVADISEIPARELAAEVPRRMATLEIPTTEYLVNPIGATLHSVAMPETVDYSYRFHDIDGFIGLVNAKRRLRQSNVPADEIAETLADEEAIPWRDPYSGDPYQWNRDSGTLSFATPSRHPRDNSLHHAAN